MNARRLLIALLLVLPAAGAEERILGYDVELELAADGALAVIERITVHAEGKSIRRGIYRDFPTRYTARHGRRVNVDFDVIGVERDAVTEAWFTESLSNGVRLNTGGDAFLAVPADYTYTLRYRTNRQVGFFDDHDELYFNAIGTGWAFAIESGQVEARLPQPVAVERMQVEAYTGAAGAQGRDYRAELPSAGVARWQLTRPLAPHEGLTVVLSFPKGVVTPPARWQQLWWLLRDNRGLLIVAAGFIMLLGYCIARWRQVGRDPARGIVIPRYEAPEYGPASLRYLVRSAFDARCFTAEVLALAVAGRLEIARESGWFKDAWTLSAREGTAPAGASGRVLLDTLFRGGARQLALKRSNATILSAANQAHSAALKREIEPRLLQRNSASVTVAVVIIVATALLAHFFGGELGVMAAMIMLVPSVLVVIVFTRLVRAPTVEGRALLDEIEGFKLYLGVAERDELAALPGPQGSAPPVLDAARYERLLPYAVALDVEDAWTEKFTLAVGAAAAAAAVGALGWYHGGSIGNVADFSTSLGSTLNSAVASASTPPGSTSGGGGGGSSGGGGGGGGGGGR